MSVRRGVSVPVKARPDRRAAAIVGSGLVGAAIVATAAVERSLRRRGGSDGVEAIETFVVIDAPVSRVWDEIADVERQTRWMRELKRVALLTDGPIGVGTRAEGTVRIGGIPVRDEIVITTFDPPARFAIRHEGLFAGDGTIDLEAGADGRSTIVRWRERLVPPVLPALASRIQAPILREIFQADLHGLRRLLEETPGQAIDAVATAAQPTDGGQARVDGTAIGAPVDGAPTGDPVAAR